MRICILIGGFPPEHIGGAEIQAEELARRLSGSHAVTVLTRGNPSMPVDEERDGFRIHRPRVSNIRMLRTIADFSKSLWFLTRRRKEFDVLLCYQVFSAGLLGVLAKRLLGLPVVVWIRGRGGISFSSSYMRKSVGLPAVRWADLVLVQSVRMKQFLLEEVGKFCGDDEAAKMDGKTLIIPNIVRFGGGGEECGGTNVLFLGRLVRRKGVDDLLDAVRKAGDLRLVIAGAGPERQNLEKYSAGLNVDFLGLVGPDRIPELLRQARVLVLPSRLGEGLPNVVIEAMAFGVPVIATDVGGTPDVVKDGVTGFVVNPGDVDGIADRLKKLYQDNELWQTMSTNSRVEVQKYAWQNIVPLVEEVLRKVVEKAKPSRLRV
ncbi:MAG: glycosyltransferase family 4 protein [Candidatus Eisenbacteria bacterium]|nr:glycosyltransferase family 4 protein [Candidatus Eisenbacteria bacterium]